LRWDHLSELSLDGSGGAYRGEDDLLHSDVIPVVLLAVLDKEVESKGDVVHEEVAVLLLVVQGDEYTADIKHAGGVDKGGVRF
jgi:hypothetical protein